MEKVIFQEKERMGEDAGMEDPGITIVDISTTISLCIMENVFSPFHLSTEMTGLDNVYISCWDYD